MSEPVDARGKDAGIWDAEWARVWKAHPDNAWFDYEAAVYLEQIGVRDPRRASRALKTDAFDEACGRRQLRIGLGPDVVLIDVSSRVVRHAARSEREGIVACAADVRRLPFPSATFDLVLSTSTLDHFDRRDQIEVALAELQRVLRQDGRLFVTLDNPANPILRLRQLVYDLTGSIRGVIPFRMGLTLSHRDLVDAAEQAGFEVSESGYVVHAPRVLALWAGEWAARRGAGGTARRLGALLRAIERTAGRLPTRRWTAHFIFADCRPRAADTAGLVRPRVPRWLSAWKMAEHRLRFAYLGSLPGPILARVDPPLRRAVAFCRRAAATPIYLRHPLDQWTDGTGRIAVWGARHAPHVLFRVLFDERPTVAAGPVLTLPAIVRRASELASANDVLIAHATPALAPILRRAGFHMVPGMIRLGGDPGALLARWEERPIALRGDWMRLKHAGYRVELWTHTRARSRLFYYRYLMPHARSRFRAQAEVATFGMIDRIFAAGLAVAVLAPGCEEPDAIGLVVPRADVLACIVLGTRDADPAILRSGGLAALYLEQIRLAHARRARLIDLGRCVPWASDGVFQYKLKWGFRPIPDGTQTLEYAIKVLRPESAVARRLVARGVMVREGRHYRSFAAEDLVSAR